MTLLGWAQIALTLALAANVSQIIASWPVYQERLLTLVQTGKMAILPILLVGRDFWSRIVDFEGLVEEGVISPQDLDLLRIVQTAEHLVLEQRPGP